MECATGGRSLKAKSRSYRNAVGGALLCLLSACGSPGKAIEPPRNTGASLPEPGWLRAPLSWDKLDLIEAWLANAASDYDPGLRVEAALQLGEGRLYFSQRDLEAGSVPQPSLQVRVQAAQRGFERILTDTSSSPGQRTRAQIGLRGAEALLRVPARPELAIVTRSEWRAKSASTQRMTALRGAWSRITIHHSDESTTDPRGGSLADSMHTLRSIQDYHTQDPEHRWGDIGYHFLIDSAGRIFEGRELRWQGAHAGGVDGQNNFQNLGICLLGDFESSPPSDAAVRSLELLVDHLRNEYRMPASRVFPHSKYGVTACPGPLLTEWVKRYSSR